jgi:hypothetical protein
MTPWLAGAHVVLMAEQTHTINNAQMAGVPGHELWMALARATEARVAAGERDPLSTTGPHVVTTVIRVCYICCT